MGGKFFTDIWENGGREMAHEIMKKSKKNIHDAREATKKSGESCRTRETDRYYLMASIFVVLFSWPRTN
jgi:hypothetical protein